MSVLKTVLTAAISLAALSACTVNTVPPVATTPSPVVVQTPAPQPPATNTVVVPRPY